MAPRLARAKPKVAPVEKETTVSNKKENKTKQKEISNGNVENGDTLVSLNSKVESSQLGLQDKEEFSKVIEQEEGITDLKATKGKMTSKKKPGHKNANKLDDKIKEVDEVQNELMETNENLETDKGNSKKPKEMKNKKIKVQNDEKETEIVAKKGKKVAKKAETNDSKEIENEKIIGDNKTQDSTRGRKKMGQKSTEVETDSMNEKKINGDKALNTISTKLKVKGRKPKGLEPENREDDQNEITETEKKTMKGKGKVNSKKASKQNTLVPAQMDLETENQVKEVEDENMESVKTSKDELNVKKGRKAAPIEKPSKENVKSKERKQTGKKQKEPISIQTDPETDINMQNGEETAEPENKTLETKGKAKKGKKQKDATPPVLDIKDEVPEKNSEVLEKEPLLKKSQPKKQQKSKNKQEKQEIEESQSNNMKSVSNSEAEIISDSESPNSNIKQADENLNDEVVLPKSNKRGLKPKAKDEPSNKKQKLDEKDSKDKKKGPLKNKSATNYETLDFSNSSNSINGDEWNFKIANWNVDGIRAWITKGGLDYINYEKPDIICLQEVKCLKEKLPEETNIPGYHSYWLCSDSSGYAGVGIFTTKLAINVQNGLGDEELDSEGRVITAEYEPFYLISTYVPNAGRKLVTLPKRLKWNEAFRNHVKNLDKKKPVIICGDMNVAHNEIDLANPKGNKKNAGFTEEERAGMSDLLGDGFVDTFRHLYPDKRDAYTFWTYMANSRAKNVGWRLDYFIISKRLLPSLCDSVIRSEVYGSDHCPISLFLHLTSAQKPK